MVFSLHNAPGFCNSRTPALTVVLENAKKNFPTKLDYLNFRPDCFRGALVLRIYVRRVRFNPLKTSLTSKRLIYIIRKPPKGLKLSIEFPCAGFLHLMASKEISKGQQSLRSNQRSTI
jgi:hypothetical protein